MFSVIVTNSGQQPKVVRFVTGGKTTENRGGHGRGPGELYFSKFCIGK